MLGRILNKGGIFEIQSGYMVRKLILPRNEFSVCGNGFDVVEGLEIFKSLGFISL